MASLKVSIRKIEVSGTPEAVQAALAQLGPQLAALVNGTVDQASIEIVMPKPRVDDGPKVKR